MSGSHHADRIWQPFGHIGGAVDGIERDVETRRVLSSASELVSEKDARSLILDSFANDDLSADVDQVEHAVDCVARSLIRGFLISTAKLMDGIQRGVLRGSDKFELNGPLDVLEGAHRDRLAEMPKTQSREKTHARGSRGL